MVEGVDRDFVASQNNAKRLSDRSLLRFQYCSDLHLEFYSDKYDMSKLLEPSANYLIVAGDLCTVEHPNFARFFDEYCSKYKYIFYTTGNHEYYSHTRMCMSDIEIQIRMILDKYPNVIYLQNTCVSLDSNGDITELAEYLPDSVTLCGTTLWSPIKSKLSEMIRRAISDYSMIWVDNNRRITPSEITQKYKINHAWLDYELSDMVSKCVIISHHLPSHSCVDSKYKESPFNCAFAAECDDIIQRYLSTKSCVWVCGHTHSSIDMDIKERYQNLKKQNDDSVTTSENKCRVVCNPKGYNNENPEYSKSKTFVV